MSAAIRISTRQFIEHFNTRFGYLAANYATANVEQVVYPPVKTRFPPAEKWGALSEKQAWEWRNQEIEFSKKSTQERIQSLASDERLTWKLDIPQVIPRNYDYQAFVTKTHTIDGLPQIYNDLDVAEIVSELKPILIDAILSEKSRIRRIELDNLVHDFDQTRQRSNVLLKKIIYTLHSALSCRFDHVHNTQLDENVRVEGFWDRYRMNKEEFEDPDDNEKDETNDVKPEKVKRYARIFSEYVADFQIRSENPLPEFIAGNDKLCMEGSYPHLQYSPVVFFQESKEKTSSTMPGFKPGDPCGYGHINILATNAIDDLEGKYGSQLIRQLHLGYGMSASFLWLVSLAHNNGFNSCQDIIYPYTTQTILTDGRRFSFFSYQLNTLKLWKDDEGNSLRNICWNSEDMDLYGAIEDDQIIDFNENCLENLIKFFAFAPSPKLKLLLQPDIDNDKAKYFLNFKSEEKVEVKEFVYDHHED